jgi:hypothetical protein
MLRVVIKLPFVPVLLRFPLSKNCVANLFEVQIFDIKVLRNDGDKVFPTIGDSIEQNKTLHRVWNRHGGCQEAGKCGLHFV